MMMSSMFLTHFLYRLEDELEVAQRLWVVCQREIRHKLISSALQLINSWPSKTASSSDDLESIDVEYREAVICATQDDARKLLREYDSDDPAHAQLLKELLDCDKALALLQMQQYYAAATQNEIGFQKDTGTTVVFREPLRSVESNDLKSVALREMEKFYSSLTQDIGETSGTVRYRDSINSEKLTGEKTREMSSGLGSESSYHQEVSLDGGQSNVNLETCHQTSDVCGQISARRGSDVQNVLLAARLPKRTHDQSEKSNRESSYTTDISSSYEDEDAYALNTNRAKKVRNLERLADREVAQITSKIFVKGGPLSESNLLQGEGPSLEVVSKERLIDGGGRNKVMSELKREKPFVVDIEVSHSSQLNTDSHSVAGGPTVPKEMSVKETAIIREEREQLNVKESSSYIKLTSTELRESNKQTTKESSLASKEVAMEVEEIALQTLLGNQSVEDLSVVAPVDNYPQDTSNKLMLEQIRKGETNGLPCLPEELSLKDTLVVEQANAQTSKDEAVPLEKQRSVSVEDDGKQVGNVKQSVSETSMEIGEDETKTLDRSPSFTQKTLIGNENEQRFLDTNSSAILMSMEVEASDQMLEDKTFVKSFLEADEEMEQDALNEQATGKLIPEMLVKDKPETIGINESLKHTLMSVEEKEKHLLEKILFEKQLFESEEKNMSEENSFKAHFEKEVSENPILEENLSVQQTPMDVNEAELHQTEKESLSTKSTSIAVEQKEQQIFDKKASMVLENNEQQTLKEELSTMLSAEENLQQISEKQKPSSMLTLSGLDEQMLEKEGFVKQTLVEVNERHQTTKDENVSKKPTSLEEKPNKQQTLKEMSLFVNDKKEHKILEQPLAEKRNDQPAMEETLQQTSVKIDTKHDDQVSKSSVKMTSIPIEDQHRLENSQSVEDKSLTEEAIRLQNLEKVNSKYCTSDALKKLDALEKKQLDVLTSLSVVENEKKTLSEKLTKTQISTLEETSALKQDFLAGNKEDQLSVERTVSVEVKNSEPEDISFEENEYLASIPEEREDILPEALVEDLSEKSKILAVETQKKGNAKKILLEQSTSVLVEENEMEIQQNKSNVKDTPMALQGNDQKALTEELSGSDQEKETMVKRNVSDIQTLNSENESKGGILGTKLDTEQNSVLPEINQEDSQIKEIKMNEQERVEKELEVSNGKEIVNKEQGLKETSIPMEGSDHEYSKDKLSAKPMTIEVNDNEQDTLEDQASVERTQIAAEEKEQLTHENSLSSTQILHAGENGDLQNLTKRISEEPSSILLEEQLLQAEEKLNILKTVSAGENEQEILQNKWSEKSGPMVIEENNQKTVAEELYFNQTSQEGKSNEVTFKDNSSINLISMKVEEDGLQTLQHKMLLEETPMEVDKDEQQVLKENYFVTQLSPEERESVVKKPFERPTSVVLEKIEKETLENISSGKPTSVVEGINERKTLIEIPSAELTSVALKKNEPEILQESAEPKSVVLKKNKQEILEEMPLVDPTSVLLNKNEPEIMKEISSVEPKSVVLERNEHETLEGLTPVDQTSGLLENNKQETLEDMTSVELTSVVLNRNEPEPMEEMSAGNPNSELVIKKKQDTAEMRQSPKPLSVSVSDNDQDSIAKELVIKDTSKLLEVNEPQNLEDKLILESEDKDDKQVLVKNMCESQVEHVQEVQLLRSEVPLNDGKQTYAEETEMQKDSSVLEPDSEIDKNMVVLTAEKRHKQPESSFLNEIKETVELKERNVEMTEVIGKSEVNGLALTECDSRLINIEKQLPHVEIELRKRRNPDESKNDQDEKFVEIKVPRLSNADNRQELIKEEMQTFFYEKNIEKGKQSINENEKQIAKGEEAKYSQGIQIELKDESTKNGNELELELKQDKMRREIFDCFDKDILAFTDNMNTDQHMSFQNLDDLKADNEGHVKDIVNDLKLLKKNGEQAKSQNTVSDQERQKTAQEEPLGEIESEFGSTKPNHEISNRFDEHLPSSKDNSNIDEQMSFAETYEPQLSQPAFIGDGLDNISTTDEDKRVISEREKWTRQHVSQGILDGADKDSPGCSGKICINQQTFLQKLDDVKASSIEYAKDVIKDSQLTLVNEQVTRQNQETSQEQQTTMEDEQLQGVVSEFERTRSGLQIANVFDEHLSSMDNSRNHEQMSFAEKFQPGSVGEAGDNITTTDDDDKRLINEQEEWTRQQKVTSQAKTEAIILQIKLQEAAKLNADASLVECKFPTAEQPATAVEENLIHDIVGQKQELQAEHSQDKFGSVSDAEDELSAILAMCSEDREIMSIVADDLHPTDDTIHLDQITSYHVEKVTVTYEEWNVKSKCEKIDSIFIEHIISSDSKKDIDSKDRVFNEITVNNSVFNARELVPLEDCKSEDVAADVSVTRLEMPSDVTDKVASDAQLASQLVVINPGVDSLNLHFVYLPPTKEDPLNILNDNSFIVECENQTSGSPSIVDTKGDVSVLDNDSNDCLSSVDMYSDNSGLFASNQTFNSSNKATDSDAAESMERTDYMYNHADDEATVIDKKDEAKRSKDNEISDPNKKGKEPSKLSDMMAGLMFIDDGNELEEAYSDEIAGEFSGLDDIAEFAQIYDTESGEKMDHVANIQEFTDFVRFANPDGVTGLRRQSYIEKLSTIEEGTDVEKVTELNANESVKAYETPVVVLTCDLEKTGDKSVDIDKSANNYEGICIEKRVDRNYTENVDSCSQVIETSDVKKSTADNSDREMTTVEITENDEIVQVQKSLEREESENLHEAIDRSKISNKLADVYRVTGTDDVVKCNESSDFKNEVEQNKTFDIAENSNIVKQSEFGGATDIIKQVELVHTTDTMRFPGVTGINETKRDIEETSDVAEKASINVEANTSEVKVPDLAVHIDETLGEIVNANFIDKIHVSNKSDETSDIHIRGDIDREINILNIVHDSVRGVESDEASDLSQVVDIDNMPNVNESMLIRREAIFDGIAKDPAISELASDVVEVNNSNQTYDVQQFNSESGAFNNETNQLESKLDFQEQIDIQYTTADILDKIPELDGIPNVHTLPEQGEPLDTEGSADIDGITIDKLASITHAEHVDENNKLDEGNDVINIVGLDKPMDVTNSAAALDKTNEVDKRLQFEESIHIDKISELDITENGSEICKREDFAELDKTICVNQAVDIDKDSECIDRTLNIIPDVKHTVDIAQSHEHDVATVTDVCEKGQLSERVEKKLEFDEAADNDKRTGDDLVTRFDRDGEINRSNETQDKPGLEITADKDSGAELVLKVAVEETTEPQGSVPGEKSLSELHVHESQNKTGNNLTGTDEKPKVCAAVDANENTDLDKKAELNGTIDTDKKIASDKVFRTLELNINDDLHRPSNAEESPEQITGVTQTSEMDIEAELHGEADIDRATNNVMKNSEREEAIKNAKTTTSDLYETGKVNETLDQNLTANHDEIVERQPSINETTVADLSDIIIDTSKIAIKLEESAEDSIVCKRDRTDDVLKATDIDRAVENISEIVISLDINKVNELDKEIDVIKVGGLDKQIDLKGTKQPSEGVVIVGSVNNGVSAKLDKGNDGERLAESEELMDCDQKLDINRTTDVSNMSDLRSIAEIDRKGVKSSKIIGKVEDSTVVASQSDIDYTAGIETRPPGSQDPGDIASTVEIDSKSDIFPVYDIKERIDIDKPNEKTDIVNISDRDRTSMLDNVVERDVASDFATKLKLGKLPESDSKSNLVESSDIAAQSEQARRGNADVEAEIDYVTLADKEKDLDSVTNILEETRIPETADFGRATDIDRNADLMADNVKAVDFDIRTDLDSTLNEVNTYSVAKEVNLNEVADINKKGAQQATTDITQQTDINTIAYMTRGPEPQEAVDISIKALLDQTMDKSQQPEAMEVAVNFVDKLVHDTTLDDTKNPNVPKNLDVDRRGVEIVGETEMFTDHTEETVTSPLVFTEGRKTFEDDLKMEVSRASGVDEITKVANRDEIAELNYIVIRPEVDEPSDGAKEADIKETDDIERRNDIVETLDNMSKADLHGTNNMSTSDQEVVVCTESFNSEIHLVTDIVVEVNSNKREYIEKNLEFEGATDVLPLYSTVDIAGEAGHRELADVDRENMGTDGKIKEGLLSVQTVVGRTEEITNIMNVVDLDRNTDHDSVLEPADTLNISKQANLEKHLKSVSRHDDLQASTKFEAELATDLSIKTNINRTSNIEPKSPESIDNTSQVSLKKTKDVTVELNFEKISDVDKEHQLDIFQKLHPNAEKNIDIKRSGIDEELANDTNADVVEATYIDSSDLLASSESSKIPDLHREFEIIRTFETNGRTDAIQRAEVDGTINLGGNVEMNQTLDGVQGSDISIASDTATVENDIAAKTADQDAKTVEQTVTVNVNKTLDRAPGTIEHVVTANIDKAQDPAVGTDERVVTAKVYEISDRAAVTVEHNIAVNDREITHPAVGKFEDDEAANIDKFAEQSIETDRTPNVSKSADQAGGTVDHDVAALNAKAGDLASGTDDHNVTPIFDKEAAQTPETVEHEEPTSVVKLDVVANVDKTVDQDDGVVEHETTASVDLTADETAVGEKHTLTANTDEQFGQNVIADANKAVDQAAEALVNDVTADAEETADQTARAPENNVTPNVDKADDQAAETVEHKVTANVVKTCDMTERRVDNDVTVNVDKAADQAPETIEHELAANVDKTVTPASVRVENDVRTIEQSAETTGEGVISNVTKGADQGAATLEHAEDTKTSHSAVETVAHDEIANVDKTVGQATGKLDNGTTAKIDETAYQAAGTIELDVVADVDGVIDTELDETSNLEVRTEFQENKGNDKTLNILVQPDFDVNVRSPQMVEIMNPNDKEGSDKLENFTEIKDQRSESDGLNLVYKSTEQLESEDLSRASHVDLTADQISDIISKDHEVKQTELDESVEDIDKVFDNEDRYPSVDVKPDGIVDITEKAKLVVSNPVNEAADILDAITRIAEIEGKVEPLNSIEIYQLDREMDKEIVGIDKINIMDDLTQMKKPDRTSRPADDSGIKPELEGSDDISETVVVDKISEVTAAIEDTNTSDIHAIADNISTADVSKKCSIDKKDQLDKLPDTGVTSYIDLVTELNEVVNFETNIKLTESSNIFVTVQNESIPIYDIHQVCPSETVDTEILQSPMDTIFQGIIPVGELKSESKQNNETKGASECIDHKTSHVLELIEKVPHSSSVEASHAEASTEHPIASQDGYSPQEGQNIPSEENTNFDSFLKKEQTPFKDNLTSVSAVTNVKMMLADDDRLVQEDGHSIQKDNDKPSTVHPQELLQLPLVKDQMVADGDAICTEVESLFADAQTLPAEQLAETSGEAVTATMPSDSSKQMLQKDSDHPVLEDLFADIGLASDDILKIISIEGHNYLLVRDKSEDRSEEKLEEIVNICNYVEEDTAMRTKVITDMDGKMKPHEVFHSSEVISSAIETEFFTKDGLDSATSIAKTVGLGLLAVVAGPVIAGKAIYDALHKDEDSKKLQASSINRESLDVPLTDSDQNRHDLDANISNGEKVTSEILTSTHNVEKLLGSEAETQQDILETVVVTCSVDSDSQISPDTHKLADETLNSGVIINADREFQYVEGLQRDSEYQMESDHLAPADGEVSPTAADITKISDALTEREASKIAGAIVVEEAQPDSNTLCDKATVIKPATSSSTAARDDSDTISDAFSSSVLTIISPSIDASVIISQVDKIHSATDEVPEGDRNLLGTKSLTVDESSRLDQVIRLTNEKKGTDSTNEKEDANVEKEATNKKDDLNKELTVSSKIEMQNNTGSLNTENESQGTQEEALSLSVAIQSAMYDRKHNAFLNPCTGQLVGLVEAIDIGIIKGQDKIVADLESGEVISVREALERNLIDSVTGQFLLDGKYVSLGDAFDSDLIMDEAIDCRSTGVVSSKDSSSNATVQSYSLVEALKLGFYKSQSNEVTDPVTGRVMSLLVALDSGLITSDSIMINDIASGKCIPFNALLEMGLIDLEKGTVKDSRGNDISFQAALDDGMLSDERIVWRPMKMIQLFDLGLYDALTGNFLDPETDEYLTLTESIEDNLLDTQSVVVNNPSTQEVLSLTKAMDSGLISGRTSYVTDTSTMEKISLYEAMQRGIVIARPMSVAMAVNIGLFNEATAKFLDPTCGLYFALQEAVEHGLIDSQSIIVDPATGKVMAVAVATACGVLDSRHGNLINMHTGQVISLKQMVADNQSLFSTQQMVSEGISREDQPKYRIKHLSVIFEEVEELRGLLLGLNEKPSIDSAKEIEKKELAGNVSEMPSTDNVGKDQDEIRIIGVTVEPDDQYSSMAGIATFDCLVPIELSLQFFELPQMKEDSIENISTNSGLGEISISQQTLSLVIDFNEHKRESTDDSHFKKSPSIDREERLIRKSPDRDSVKLSDLDSQGERSNIEASSSNFVSSRLDAFQTIVQVKTDLCLQERVILDEQGNYSNETIINSPDKDSVLNSIPIDTEKFDNNGILSDENLVAERRNEVLLLPSLNASSLETSADVTVKDANERDHLGQSRTEEISVLDEAQPQVTISGDDSTLHRDSSAVSIAAEFDVNTEIIFNANSISESHKEKEQEQPELKDEPEMTQLLVQHKELQLVTQQQESESSKQQSLETNSKHNVQLHPSKLLDELNVCEVQKDGSVILEDVNRDEYDPNLTVEQTLDMEKVTSNVGIHCFNQNMEILLKLELIGAQQKFDGQVEIASDNIQEIEIPLQQKFDAQEEASPDINQEVEIPLQQKLDVKVEVSPDINQEIEILLQQKFDGQGDIAPDANQEIKILLQQKFDGQGDIAPDANQEVEIFLQQKFDVHVEVSPYFSKEIETSLEQKFDGQGEVAPDGNEEIEIPLEFELTGVQQKLDGQLEVVPDIENEEPLSQLQYQSQKSELHDQRLEPDMRNESEQSLLDQLQQSDLLNHSKAQHVQSGNDGQVPQSEIERQLLDQIQQPVLQNQELKVQYLQPESEAQFQTVHSQDKTQELKKYGGKDISDTIRLLQTNENVCAAEERNILSKKEENVVPMSQVVSDPSPQLEQLKINIDDIQINPDTQQIVEWDNLPNSKQECFVLSQSDQLVVDTEVKREIKGQLEITKEVGGLEAADKHAKEQVTVEIKGGDQGNRELLEYELKNVIQPSLQQVEMFGELKLNVIEHNTDQHGLQQYDVDLDQVKSATPDELGQAKLSDQLQDQREVLAEKPEVDHYSALTDQPPVSDPELSEVQIVQKRSILEDQLEQSEPKEHQLVLPDEQQSSDKHETLLSSEENNLLSNPLTQDDSLTSGKTKRDELALDETLQDQLIIENVLKDKSDQDIQQFERIEPELGVKIVKPDEENNFNIDTISEQQTLVQSTFKPLVMDLDIVELQGTNPQQNENRHEDIDDSMQQRLGDKQQLGEFNVQIDLSHTSMQEHLSELQDEKQLSEIQKQKQLSELHEQKQLSELQDEKLLSELENDKQQSELQDQTQQSEQQNKKQLSELQDEKQLSELQEPKQLSELQEPKQLSEVQDEKQLSELQEPKQLSELQEPKQLSELQDEKQLSQLQDEKQLSQLQEPKQLSELLEPKQLSELQEPKQLSELQDEKQLSQLRVQKQLSEVPEHTQQSELPEHTQHSELPEHNQQSELSDHIHQSEIPDHTQQSEIPEHTQQSKLADHIQQSELPDHIQQSEIPDHTQQSKLPEHTQQSEVKYQLEFDIVDQKPEKQSNEHPDESLSSGQDTVNELHQEYKDNRDSQDNIQLKSSDEQHQVILPEDQGQETYFHNEHKLQEGSVKRVGEDYERLLGELVEHQSWLISIQMSLSETDQLNADPALQSNQLLVGTNSLYTFSSLQVVFFIKIIIC